MTRVFRQSVYEKFSFSNSSSNLGIMILQFTCGTDHPNPFKKSLLTHITPPPKFTNWLLPPVAA
jgi:hypothetical protein